ncbi:Hypothetical protein Y17_4305 [Pectobacterium wasabiae CFBP 3304]|nr:Hypothetical protein Y17_4305 [Pectobacterium wasabiae CFBP 3304]
MAEKRDSKVGLKMRIKEIVQNQYKKRRVM